MGRKRHTADINRFDNQQFATNLFAFATTPQPRACAADTNGDGVLTPADFNAWVIAFNAQVPGCEQNVDALCAPADLNSSILNFNTGA